MHSHRYGAWLPTVLSRTMPALGYKRLEIPSLSIYVEAYNSFFFPKQSRLLPIANFFLGDTRLPHRPFQSGLLHSIHTA